MVTIAISTGKTTLVVTLYRLTPGYSMTLYFGYSLLTCTNRDERVYCETGADRGAPS